VKLAAFLAMALCLLNESDQVSHSAAYNFPSLVLSVSIHRLGVHSANHVQFVESRLIGHVASKLDSRGSNFVDSFAVVELPDFIGVRDHYKFLFPSPENFEQIALSRFFAGFIGMRSRFSVTSQGGAVNYNPPDYGDNGGETSNHDGGFWAAYLRVMPLTMLLFGVTCYLCYRHGRWVERGRSHE